MTSPKSLHVFGKKYRLKRLKRLDNKGINGEIDEDLREISINSKLPLNEDEYWITILHEVIHAVIYETSIYQIISRDAEELIADNIPKVLLKNFNLSHKIERKRSK